MASKFAYVTLLTKDEYLAGVLVLNHGLKAVNSEYPLVVMATPTLSPKAKEILKSQDIVLEEVETLLPRHELKLDEADERFRDIYTKLRGFELYDYKRIVLLDSDMLIMKNMDDLFHMPLPEDEIAAAHVCACNPRQFKHYPADWIPANCAHTKATSPTALPVDPKVATSEKRPHIQLNSGTLVLHPSETTAKAVLDFLDQDERCATFKFPDQDLLTVVFEGKWKSLHWYYNALRTLRNIHKNLWDDREVRCLHYILADKPWQSRAMINDEQFGEVNKWWWDHFDQAVQNIESKDSAKFVEGLVDYKK